MNDAVKKCSKCGTVKSIEDFYRAKEKKDGRRPDCKDCRSKIAHIWRKANSEKLKVDKHNWYEVNKERCHENARIRYRANPEKVKECVRKYRRDNPEKVKERNRKWCKANHEKWMENARRFIRLNPEKRKECARRSVKKYRSTFKGNLSSRISVAINASLRGNKNGRHWETLVDYTLSDLIKRLKRTMPIEYTWKDFLSGKLHIDHIIPISKFNFEKPEDIDFKRCWALKNLQLLPAKENLSKHDKIDKSFQPSLIYGGKQNDTRRSAEQIF